MNSEEVKSEKVKRKVATGDFFLAEKERFELSNRLWRLHDFQSCALDQLGDFSMTNMRCGFHRALIVYHKNCHKSIVLCNFQNLFLYFCAVVAFLSAKIRGLYVLVVILHKNKTVFSLCATDGFDFGI